MRLSTLMLAKLVPLSLVACYRQTAATPVVVGVPGTAGATSANGGRRRTGGMDSTGDTGARDTTGSTGATGSLGYDGVHVNTGNTDANGYWDTGITVLMVRTVAFAPQR